VVLVMNDELLKKVITDRVAMALEEDLGGYGDITTNAIEPTSEIGVGQIRSKGEGILCGIEVAKETFLQLDPEVEFPACLEDGKEIHHGMVVLEVRGKSKALLKGERTALNFLARLSGVATMANRAVKAVAGTGVDILDTRKTIPGFRLLDKYAVRVGGGKNHRWGLFDQFLIKENHIQAAGGISAAITAARRHLEKVKASMKWIPESAHAKALGRPVVIEVEVRNLEEIKEALDCGVDCLLLDNMSPKEIKNAVTVIAGKARVEISGGVTIERLSELAKLGVDAISMGALTHSAPAHDFSMLIL
jgi:nicotinate-nucleotide pyrophosphorylase (carboxylating)